MHIGITGNYQISKDSGLKKVLIASLITAFIPFIYFIIKGHGAFTLVDDFNAQQLTFAPAIQNTLKAQKPGEWCWNLDLGSSLITGFSFYDLGSIFYWISFIFPENSFPYLVGFLYILKYVVASCSAYFYLKRFVKNQDYAVIGGLLYAFSGFQATNLEFYHFHDVVAFFPILLIGLEDLINEGKKGIFTFAVFLNCITNYFFFIQEVIFLILYFLVRFWKKPITWLLKKIVLCVALGILGIGMASVLFIPSVMYVRGSNRSDTIFYLSELVYGTQGFLFILKGFLFPGEPMRSHSAIIPQEWNSTSCYLPFAGLTFVLSYIEKKHHDWLKNLLIIFYL